LATKGRALATQNEQNENDPEFHFLDDNERGSSQTMPKPTISYHALNESEPATQSHP